MTAVLASTRRSLAGAALCLLLGAAMSCVVLSPSGAQDVDLGNDYISRARDAALSTDFIGTVQVTWRGPDGVEQRRVTVRSQDGILSIGGAGGMVVQGPARFALLEDGWATVWAQSPSRPVRTPSRKWNLSVRGGEVIAGRATREVTAEDRETGGVRERRSFDAVTGLLLRRELFNDEGNRVRTIEFTSITLPEEGAPSAAPIVVPSDSHLEQPSELEQVPPGYDVPIDVGDGFQLNGAYRHNDGTVQLFYSDGLFSASVFEQKGSLDREDLEPGGVDRVLAGERVQQYDAPMGTVLVWEGDGVVYTSVSDAPLDELRQIVGSFDDEPDPLDRAISFLTGPFTW
jgi:hypothetical protein